MITKPRETFRRELGQLLDQVLALGSMVEDAILVSVAMLKKRDIEGSRRIIERDQEINAKRFEIEDQALALIALHQPVARDLRLLGAILEVATELERIGDYAKGIAKVNVLMGDAPLLKPLIDIPFMAGKAMDMLRQSLDAFVSRDIQAAQTIPALDDEVDALYNQVYRELITYILDDPRCIEQANHLLWVAHNLERAADRVSNVCERTIFMVTGKMQELN
ncbi:MAG: phosphate signaling complex protein PhoU [Anaerolineae bacterium]